MDVQIVVSVNRKFIPLLGVLIRSICLHASEGNHYCVSVLHSKLRACDKRRLENEVFRSNVMLSFVDMTEWINGVDFFVANRESITQEAYYRLFLPWIMPERSEVVYLDCDTVIHADPALLLTAFHNENAVACVRDYTGIGIHYSGEVNWNSYYQDELGIQNFEEYFNDGVMVMNLAWMRAHVSHEDMRSMIMERAWKFHDQDILNVLCKGCIQYLDVAWNYVGKNRYLQYLPDALLAEIAGAENRVKLYHYAGIYDKVWQRMTYEAMTYFWPVAEQTGFYGDFLEMYVLDERVR